MNEKRILDHVFAGMHIDLASCGPALVQKLIVHGDTKELVAEVKADSGQALCLSMKYIERILGAA